MVVGANPPLSDLVELLGISNDNLDAHFQLGLLEAEVQAGDFGIDDTFCHFYVENKQRVKNLFSVTKPLCESVVINNPIQLFGQRRNETVDKRLSLRSRGQGSLSHAYHCLYHDIRHSSKMKWEFN